MSTISKVNLPDQQQYQLFEGMPETRDRSVLDAVASGRRFVTADPHDIYLGTTRLETHLEQSGQRAPFTIARLLDEQDWTPFERCYAATGRAPYAPRSMMGLILYGVMNGVSSLRDLERLGRLDLGCMWVSGGIAPDHASVGRFIAFHESLLTQDFFESLTRSILKASGADAKRLAGDGTVIEAACSHYRLLKEEALRDRVQGAREAALQAPNDVAAQRGDVQATQCQAIFDARKEARRRVGVSAPMSQRRWCNV